MKEADSKEIPDADWSFEIAPYAKELADAKAVKAAAEQTKAGFDLALG